MKFFKIIINLHAVADIVEAADCSLKQLPGLGKRFKEQVKATINSLKNNPDAYTTRYADVRCILIPKFPFLIHFKITKNTVEVFAIFHMSRNPKIWEQRRKK